MSNQKSVDDPEVEDFMNDACDFWDALHCSEELEEEQKGRDYEVVRELNEINNRTD